MMNYVLFDDSAWSDLLPLTFTRPSCEIRIGILTIKEKWQKRLKAEISYKTENYLSEKFPFNVNQKFPCVYINGRVCPDEILVNEIKKLKIGQALYKAHTLVAYNGKDGEKIQSKSQGTVINHPWDIFRNNGKELEIDFTLITKGRKSKPLSKSNKVIGKGKIFIESGAIVECAILNTHNGSIYIGKDS